MYNMETGYDGEGGVGGKGRHIIGIYWYITY